MKRILFLTQILPYPTDAGPKMRAYYVLRQLAKEHEVHLVSFVRPSDKPEAFAHLRQFCKTVTGVEMRRSRARDLAALLSSIQGGEPFLITRDRSAEMEGRLRELVETEHFDAIHADQLWMAAYAQWAGKYARLKGADPLLVLDQHNAVFRIPERMAGNHRNPLVKWFLKREARLMRGYEQRVCSQFGRVVWVSAEDREAVLEAGETDASRHPVIPICIEPPEMKVSARRNSQPVVLFIGGMHWPPNAEGMTWFADQVLGHVQEQVPDVRLVVIGKSPPSRLKMLDSVDAPGFVENLEGYWEKSRVFIVPLLSGGGMRVKILDAWAHGLAVVSTTIGAEGIECHPGEDILIADEPQEFAARLSRLLSDPEYACRIGLAGRRQAERRYDWKNIYPAWERVYGLLPGVGQAGGEQ